jgi:hypothetical protein
MAKISGLGQKFFWGGYDISGDVGSLSGVSSPLATLDVTAVDKYAMERIGGEKDGTLAFQAFYNTAANQAHAILKTLPTTDTSVIYATGPTIGADAACMVTKQIGYDGTRAADGGYTFAVQAQANGYGLEWGQLLTAGLRTDTAATSPATGLDTTSSLSFGAQAYLQVTAFSGTDVTVKIQDSADNSTFADISPSLVFTQVTAAHAFERIAVVNTTTIRRYVRVITTTSGGFTSCSFVCAIVKNLVAGVVF